MEGVVRLWTTGKSPANWKEQTTLKGHVNGVLGMAWAGDEKNKKLVVRCGDPKVFKVWDVANGTDKEIKLDAPTIQSFAVSPDGRTLALSDSNRERGFVRLWDIEKGAERGQLSGHAQTPALPKNCFAAQLVMSRGPPLTKLLWCADYFWAKPQAPMYLSYTADGKTLVCVSMDGTVERWDSATGKEHGSFKAKERIRLAALAPNGETIALGFAGPNDRATRLWDMTTNAEKQKSGPLQVMPKELMVQTLVYSPDGKTLAGMAGDFTLHLWDAATGAERFPAREHLGPVHVVAFTPDCKSVITGGMDRMLRIWDIAAHNVKAEQQLPASVGFLIVSPDGKTLVVPGKESGLSIRNVADLKEVVALKKHSAAVLAVAYAPDGKSLAAAGMDHPVPNKPAPDKTIVIWELPRGKELSNFNVQTMALTALTYSPDGKTLAAVCMDRKDKDKPRELERTIKLWDVASGQVQSSWPIPGSLAAALAYSPDGKTLACAATDKSIKLWDLAAGKERASLQGHNSIPSGLAFTADGKRLISQEHSGTGSRILVWDLTTTDAKPVEWQIPGQIRSMAVASDGRHIAAAHANGTVLILRVVSGGR